MLEVTLPAPPNAIKIDVCRRCEVLWFDPGELESVAAAAPQPSEQSKLDNLPPEAREQLALYKVRMLQEQANSDRWNAALMNPPIFDQWQAENLDWPTVASELLNLFL